MIIRVFSPIVKPIESIRKDWNIVKLMSIYMYIHMYISHYSGYLIGSLT